MTTTVLSELVRARAVRALARHGVDTTRLPHAVSVRLPRTAEHGHYTTNVALRGAGPTGVPARQLAEWVAADLRDADGVASVRAEEPGFVNLWLTPAAHWSAVLDVAEREPPERMPWTPPGPRAQLPVTDGSSVSMAELVRSVGTDTARFAVARAGGDMLDMPLAVLRRQDERNPAYLVRYAHARASSLAREAATLGIPVARSGDNPHHDSMAVLMRALGEFRELARSAPVRDLARYLERLADHVAVFTTRLPVLPVGDAAAGAAESERLAVTVASGRVLASGLGILGVDAPERM